MKKSESIMKLEELGLNTLDYFISSNRPEILHYLAKHSQDLLSMRTERNMEWRCPFYYMIKGETLLPIVLKHLSEGYKLIFAPSLSTKGCLAFGTVAIGLYGNDLIEFVEGEGKVRDLDNHPNKQTIVIDRGGLFAAANDRFGPIATILNTVYRDAKANAIDFSPCIIEWSWYNNLVGRLHQHPIFWEIRPCE